MIEFQLGYVKMALFTAAGVNDGLLEFVEFLEKSIHAAKSSFVKLKGLKKRKSVRAASALTTG